MKVYVWRHNKTYHSHSMINEPCVQTIFIWMHWNRSCRKSGRSLEDIPRNTDGKAMCIS